MSSVWVEMRRRKVFKGAFLYLVTAWLLLQILDVVGPILDLPDWATKLIFYVLICSLPVVLILSWKFDLTDLGLYHERPLQETNADRVPEGARRLCGLACLLTVCIGVAVSLSAAAVIRLHEASLIEDRIDMVTNEIAHEIGHRLQSSNEALHTLGALFMNGTEPDLDIFRQMASRAIAEREEVVAIEWVPRVSHADRGSFTQEMRNIYPGFLIKTFDVDSEERAVGQQKEYFPVTFTVPRSGNEKAIGFDLSTSTDRAESLHDAISSGQTQQSGPVELVQTGEPGFLMFDPVFKHGFVPVSYEARKDSLEGFMLAVLDVSSLLEQAVEITPGASNFLGQISLFPAEGSADPFIVLDTSNGSELSFWTRSVGFADGGFGRTWMVELLPTRALMAGRLSPDYIIVGASGVLISLLFGLIMSAILAAREIPEVASPQDKALNDDRVTRIRNR